MGQKTSRGIFPRDLGHLPQRKVAGGLDQQTEEAVLEML